MFSESTSSPHGIWTGVLLVKIVSNRGLRPLGHHFLTSHPHVWGDQKFQIEDKWDFWHERLGTTVVNGAEPSYRSSAMSDNFFQRNTNVWQFFFRETRMWEWSGLSSRDSMQSSDELHLQHGAVDWRLQLFFWRYQEKMHFYRHFSTWTAHRRR